MIDVTFPGGLVPASPLEKSIAHWRRMRDAETVAELRGETPSGDHCALCHVYRDPYEWPLECAGCPVYERTGRHLCSGSPYLDARRAFDAWVAIKAVGVRSNVLRAAWRTAADAEIAFLESLREPAP